MSKYYVTWATMQEADSPREAAELAWADMRAPDSIANHFSVRDLDARNEVFIDLSYEEEE